MELKLPLLLVSRHDVIRTLRELESIDDYYTQSSIRGNAHPAIPALSQLLQAIVAENKIDIAQKETRANLSKTLLLVRDKAPLVHISFAVEPSAQAVQKILFWFRKEVSPAMLLQTGIQPSIAAGCVVRTTNKYFDFSLRQHLLRNSSVLLDKLRTLA